jgi:hypothetical protein
MALRQLQDAGLVQAGHGLEVEGVEGVEDREASCLDAALFLVRGPLLDLALQQGQQVSFVGMVLAGRILGESAKVGGEGGQPQPLAVLT